MSDGLPLFIPTMAAVLVTLTGAILTYRAAMYGARTSAAAAVQASRQTALDTERLKLEFSQLQRRLDHFYNRAQELSAVASEFSRDQTARQRLLDGYPHVGWAVVDYALRVARREDGHLISEICASFDATYGKAWKACRRLKESLSKGQYPAPDEPLGDAVTSATVSLQMILHGLMSAIDASTEARTGDAAACVADIARLAAKCKNWGSSASVPAET